MPELTFDISMEDMDRLFAIKDIEGKHNLTGNQFAAEVLVQELRRRFPAAPAYDLDGELTNGDKYAG